MRNLDRDASGVLLVEEGVDESAGYHVPDAVRATRDDVTAVLDVKKQSFDPSALEADIRAYYYENADRSLAAPCVETLPSADLASVRSLLALKARYSSLKIGSVAAGQIAECLARCTLEPRPMYIVAGHMRDAERDRREEAEDMRVIRTIAMARILPCATQDAVNMLKRLRLKPAPITHERTRQPVSEASLQWQERMGEQRSEFLAYDFDGELAQLAKDAPEPPKATGLSRLWKNIRGMVYKTDAEKKYEARLQREHDLRMARRLGIAPKAR